MYFFSVFPTMLVSIMGKGKEGQGLLSLKLYLSLIIFSVTSAASADCPTECYCDDITSTTTCIGDRRLSFLPQLNLESRSEAGKLRRLEIRDYILPDLFIEEKEKLLFFQSVQELSLSYNQIQEIHFMDFADEKTQVENSGQLKLLDLSTNNLTRFTSVSDMKGLTVLDLSHNRIESISLEWLEKLESLNLRSNSIENLAEDVFQVLFTI